MFQAGSTSKSVRPSESYHMRIVQEKETGQKVSTPPATVDCTLMHLFGYYHTKLAAPMNAYLLLTCCLLSLSTATPFTITGRYCKQNVSVKYQVPVTHLSQPVRRAADANVVASTVNSTAINSNVTASTTATANYIAYEPRVRWESTNVCCPGYRALLFGFCEPICDMNCPRFSYCATPNQCECLPGHVEHHPNNKVRQLLDCRPVCVGGCPRHSHCLARNRCECQEGYRNSNTWWFMPLKCDRIRCTASDQRYDVEQRTCVKIEMSMEDLMRKIAARLAKGIGGLEDGEETEDEDHNEIEAEAKVKVNEVAGEVSLETHIEGNENDKSFCVESEKCKCLRQRLSLLKKC